MQNRGLAGCVHNSSWLTHSRIGPARAARACCDQCALYPTMQRLTRTLSAVASCLQRQACHHSRPDGRDPRTGEHPMHPLGSSQCRSSASTARHAQIMLSLVQVPPAAVAQAHWQLTASLQSVILQYSAIRPCWAPSSRHIHGSHAQPVKRVKTFTALPVSSAAAERHTTLQYHLLTPLLPCCCLLPPFLPSLPFPPSDPVCQRPGCLQDR